MSDRAYSSNETFGVTRRNLLSALSAVSALSLVQLPGRAYAADLNLDAFLELSEKLVGRQDLSNDIADEMFQVFTAIGKRDGLSALADGIEDDELSAAVVEAWYTGVSPDPDDLDVLTYTDALMWRAMDYTKPMGYCGGSTGYWAEPPST